MGFVTRNAIAKASLETVWNTCFAPLQWQTWDPDVETVEDTSFQGLKDGSQITLVMNSGKRIVATLEVTHLQRIAYVGFLWGGGEGETVRGKGRLECEILLRAENGGTAIEYTFGFNGCFGFIFSRVLSKMITEGTEVGLANIVKMAEEAAGNVTESETKTELKEEKEEAVGESNSGVMTEPETKETETVEVDVTTTLDTEDKKTE